MAELLLKAGDYIIEHGGILGVLFVIMTAGNVWQFIAAAKERTSLARRIDQLHEGTEPERVALRTRIEELQEQRVREAYSRDAASKVAIERTANALENVSTAIGENTDAIRDFENLVRRKRS